MKIILYVVNEIVTRNCCHTKVGSKPTCEGVSRILPLKAQKDASDVCWNTDSEIPVFSALCDVPETTCSSFQK